MTTSTLPDQRAPARALATSPVALRRLGRNSLLYTLAGVGHAALGVLLLPLYTRLLPPAQYGQLALVTSLATFLQVVLALSVHAPAMRLYFEYRADPARLRRLWGTLLTFALAVPVTGTLVLTLAGEHVLQPFAPGVPFHPLILLGIGAAAFQPAIDTVLGVAMAQERPLVYGLLLLGQLLLKALLALVLCGAAGLGLTGVLLGNAAANAVVLGVALVAMRRAAPPCMDRAVLRDALGYSLPLVPHLLANQARLLVDRAVLAHYIGTAVVGTYVIALQIAMVVNILMTAITRAWQPTFMRSVTEDDAEQVQHLADMGLLMALLACAVAAGVSLVAPELMQVLVSGQFRGGALLAHPLAFSFAALAIQQLLVQALYVGRGSTKRVAVASLWNLVLAVVLDLALVPLLGLVGAALSALVVQVVAAVLVAVLAHRRSRVRWPYWRLAGMFLLALAASAWPIAVVPALCFTTALLKAACWCAIVVALAAVAWNDPRRGLAKLRKAAVLTFGQRPHAAAS